mmetsp:Transcript_84196/g.225136  ORF Transcript_84196/g.225136 Transcript_84196/m.225136 type:complete len:300 (-) Transcript_84196:545-1444(-)
MRSISGTSAALDITPSMTFLVTRHCVASATGKGSAPSSVAGTVHRGSAPCASRVITTLRGVSSVTTPGMQAICSGPSPVLQGVSSRAPLRKSTRSTSKLQASPCAIAMWTASMPFTIVWWMSAFCRNSSTVHSVWPNLAASPRAKADSLLHWRTSAPLSMTSLHSWVNPRRAAMSRTESWSSASILGSAFSCRSHLQNGTFPCLAPIIMAVSPSNVTASTSAPAARSSVATSCACSRPHTCSGRQPPASAAFTLHPAWMSCRTRCAASSSQQKCSGLQPSIFATAGLAPRASNKVTRLS